MDTNYKVVKIVKEVAILFIIERKSRSIAHW